MKADKIMTLGIAAALTTLVSTSAIAGGYGMGSYGPSYGPGMGMPYGGPKMGMPARPQPPARPQRPKPPQMWGPYGYGGMAPPGMPGAYGKAPGGYGKAPSAYGQAPSSYGQAPAGYGAAAAAAPAAAVDPAAATDSASVSISQMRFDSPTVTIKAGGTVTWTNAEAMPHTVTANDGSFGSAQLGAGDTFSHTFDEPGTYSYYCQLHPMMRATVVVVG